MTEKEKPIGLDLMRVPFEPRHISKLPKQAKWMTDAKNEYKNCDICGGYHHPKAVHLDYVGHAALTDRLLDCDPNWTWEPLAFDQNGAPLIDKNGGLWIKLTVCGMMRLGYGHPDGKSGGDAIKESIGDALRNAAMRFGAALDLWHKGDLHGISEEDDTPDQEKKATKPKSNASMEDNNSLENPYENLWQRLDRSEDQQELKEAWEAISKHPYWKKFTKLEQEKLAAKKDDMKLAFADSGDFG